MDDPSNLVVSMRRLSREDIVLFGIGAAIERDDVPNLELLSEVMGIDHRSLDRVVQSLFKKGHINYIKNKSNRDQSVILSKKGGSRYSSIKMEISKRVVLTLDDGKVVNIDKLLSNISDPYGRVRLIDHLIFKRRPVQEVIESIRSMNADKRSEKMEKEVLGLVPVPEMIPLNKVLERYCIYGVCPSPEPVTPTLDLMERTHLLREAEILRRKGMIREAKEGYSKILQSSVCMESNFWVLCIVGIVQCLLYENEVDIALKMLDETLYVTKNPLQRAFLMKNIADILQDLGRMDQASDMYKHCLKVFDKKDQPILRSAILNNLGVMYNREGKLKEATRYWEDSLRIARRLRLPWIISMVSINLADVYSKKGKTRLALEYLRRARSSLKGIGDLEGLSAVDFNMALVQIDMGNHKRAEHYFERSKMFSLIYLQKAKEREEVYRSRMASHMGKKSDLP